MMQRKGRSSLFLMELILAILIFSLCASTCLQLFGSSQQMMQKSDALTRGVYLCESAAESFRVTAGRDAYAETMGADASQETWQLRYDEEWVSSSDGRYTLEIQLTQEDGLATAVFTLSDGDETLYSLTANKYAPGEVWL